MDPRRRIWVVVALVGTLSLVSAVTGLQAGPSLADRLLGLGGLLALLVGTEGVVRPDAADLPADVDALQYVAYGGLVVYAAVLFGALP